MKREAVSIRRSEWEVLHELHDIVREAIGRRGVNDLLLREIPPMPSGENRPNYARLYPPQRFFSSKAACGHCHDGRNAAISIGMLTPLGRREDYIEGEDGFPFNISISVFCRYYLGSAKVIAEYFMQKTGKSAEIVVE